MMFSQFLEHPKAYSKDWNDYRFRSDMVTLITDATSRLLPLSAHNDPILMPPPRWLV